MIYFIELNNRSNLIIQPYKFNTFTAVFLIFKEINLDLISNLH